MKYCGKCGHPMDDDMLFCQKCGSKFEDTVNVELNGISAKVEKIKKYNLVLNAESITWNYLREDGKRAGNITNKQDALCVELVDLVKEVLSEVTEEDRDFVEREVYTFVLKMGCKMCNEAAKMYANYSGFQQLFDQGNQLCMKGLLDSSTFLGQMIQQDMVYKIIASLQGLHAYRIKETLDENVIRDNLEFHALTVDLANAYNNMWYRCIKRHIDFYISPSEDLIKQNWGMYNVILKGLYVAEINKMNEQGWMLALDDAVKNHNGAGFKREFLRKRDEERAVLRKKEQDREDKKYWDAHPEEKKLLEINNAKIKNLSANCARLKNEIEAMENAKRQIENKKSTFASNITEKEQKINKLDKKIFGKKKAVEEIQNLRTEIEKLQVNLVAVDEELAVAQEPILRKKIEKSELDREIKSLEQANLDLRNK